MAGQLEEKEAAKLAGLKEKRGELVRMMAELEVSGWVDGRVCGRACGRVQALHPEVPCGVLPPHDGWRRVGSCTILK